MKINLGCAFERLILSRCLGLTAKYGWLLFALLATTVAKFFIAWHFGDTYDTRSFALVGDAVLSGQSPYVLGRYNYAPVWMYVMALLRWLCGDGIHVWVSLVIAIGDVLIAVLMWRKGLKSVALLFLLSPVGLFVSGCWRMFDNIAIAFGVLGCVVREKEGGNNYARVVAFSIIIGVSILIKHVLLFFPFWLFFCEKRWRDRLTVLLVPLGMFGLSFLVYLLPEFYTNGIEASMEAVGDLVRHGSSHAEQWQVKFPAFVGVMQNVFWYSPMKLDLFWKLLAPGILANAVRNGTVDSKCLFVGMMILSSPLMRKMRPFRALLIYLCCIFSFSSAHWPYFWTIPILSFSFLTFPLYFAFNVCSWVVWFFWYQDRWGLTVPTLLGVSFELLSVLLALMAAVVLFRNKQADEHASKCLS